MRITRSLVTALALIVLAAAGSGLAAPLVVSGTVRSERPLGAGVRVGLFSLDRAGQPQLELAGAAVAADGRFSILLGEAAPPPAAVSSLAPEALDWPGLVGRVSLSAPVRATRTVLRAYADADGSGGYSGRDTPFDSVASRGAGGSVVVVWSEAATRVLAGGGFDLALSPGWNLVLIEVGRAVAARRLEAVTGLQLDLFRR